MKIGSKFVSMLFAIILVLVSAVAFASEKEKVILGVHTLSGSNVDGIYYFDSNSQFRSFVVGIEHTGLSSKKVFKKNIVIVSQKDLRHVRETILNNSSSENNLKVRYSSIIIGPQSKQLLKKIGFTSPVLLEVTSGNPNFTIKNETTIHNPGCDDWYDFIIQENSSHVCTLKN